MSLLNQTWSGNEKVIGLIKKFGFEECNREYRFRTVRDQLYDGLTFRLNRKKYNDFREWNKIIT